MTETLTKKVIPGILLVLFGTAIGFGVQSITIGKEFTEKMAVFSVQINSNSKDITNLRDNQREWNLRQDRELEAIRQDDAANHKVQIEFIHLLKTNYELLAKMSNQNEEFLKRLQRTPP